MPKLVIKNGEKQGSVYRIADQEVSLGRDPFNTIVLPDRRVSRGHARIILENGNYVIEDTGSVNGTMVNGTMADRQILQEGDEIRLGITVLLFSSDGSPAVGVQEKNPSVTILPEEKTSPQMKIASVAHADPLKNFDTEASRIADKSGADVFRKLTTLYRVSHELGTVVNLKGLLDKILALVLEIVGADRGFIMLLNEKTGELSLPVVRRKLGMDPREEISISRTIINRVTDRGESVLTTDALQDERFKDAQSIIAHHIRSTMCVPVKYQDRMLGIMHVDTREKIAGFGKEDLELLTAISQQAAVAINNAKLFEELSQANQELKAQQEQLIEAEKMSALGKLAGGVAHEINNPMTSILGYSELAFQSLSKNNLTSDEIKECAEFVKIVEQEARRCKNIAQTLLQFGRRKKAEMASVDINEVVDASLTVAQFHIKKTPIKIENHLDRTLPKMTGDKNQLQQVFLNFIVNARDAMEQGGTLSIVTRLLDEKHIEIQFKDTGCGIPEDKREEIFKPLYTTKEEGKGTGLGLSISLDIIEKHRGTIELESEVGRGTTFFIRLPISQEGSG